MAVAIVGCDDTSSLPGLGSTNVVADAMVEWSTLDDSIAFGLIADVDVFASTVAVVDQAESRVFVVDLESELSASDEVAPDTEGRIGRRGRGPGEFQSAIAVELLSTRELLVVDQAQASLSWFRKRSGVWSFDGRSQLEFVPFDACVLKDRTVVSGFFNDRAVHEVDRATGTIVQSWLEVPATMQPELPPSLDEELRMVYASGRVLCEAERIVYYGEWWPVVATVAEEDGEERFATGLDGFVRVAATATGDGGLAFGPDPDVGYADRLVSTWWEDDRHLLVQVGRVSQVRSPQEDPVRVLSVVFDSMDAVVGQVHEGELPTFRGRWGLWRVGFTNTPIPRLVLRAAAND